MATTDKRFKYYDYIVKQRASLKELNGLMDLALYSGKSKVDAIIAGVKGIVVVVVIFARAKVQDQEMELEKQGYEMDRVDKTRDTINKDPLDVVKRPK